MFLEAIKKALSEEFFIDEDRITKESHLKDDLGIDSLSSMQLILDMEKEFHIHVEDEEVMEIETVGDVIALLEKKTKEEA